MKTNQCTYGPELDCGRHGAQWTTDKHVRRGPVVRTPKYQGAMRKHGGDNHQRMDDTLAALDACARAPVVYGPKYRGVLIRRRAS